MAKKGKPEERTPIESDLKRLEVIVDKLGSGAVPLNEAQRLYEEGMRLVATSRAQLKEARGQVVKLDKATGRLEPLEVEDP